MTDDALAELWKTQKSLTEWLDDISHADATRIRKEDNGKRERLKVLHQVIGLPFDAPTQFEASELREDNPAFIAFLKAQGDELCALRLIPKKDNLPKLRMRGKDCKGAFAWFLEQDINPKDYRADFIPHAHDPAWATIFIVNAHGIQGEIIYGGHHQLTQGFHDTSAPAIFRYDFKEWTIAPQNDAALEYLKTLADFIHIRDQAQQKVLQNRLGATFANNYLEGYFETTHSSLGTWFVDYNQTLGKRYADMIVRTAPSKTEALVRGQTGSSGSAKGEVCIVDPQKLVAADFPERGVLVCKVTTPAYVPLMQKASAIVTDQGGILSHAAIVARELGKPCIVGAGNATTVLKEYNNVVVNADEGVVVKI